MLQDDLQRCELKDRPLKLSGFLTRVREKEKLCMDKTNGIIL